MILAQLRETLQLSVLVLLCFAWCPAHAADTGIKEIPLFEASKQAVESFKNQGYKTVCVINVATLEANAPDKKSFPAQTLGAPVKPGSKTVWLDLTKLSLIQPLIDHRIEACKELGFDSIRFAGLNKYHTQDGSPVDEELQKTYNQWLVSRAREHGLSVTKKKTKSGEPGEDTPNDPKKPSPETGTPQDPNTKTSTEAKTTPGGDVVAPTQPKPSPSKALTAPSNPSSASSTNSPAARPSSSIISGNGSAPSNSTAGRGSTWPAQVAAASANTGGWKPDPNSSFDYQLHEPKDYSVQVAMIDLDLFDTPPADIKNLKARGLKVVCYVSAGTGENWRNEKDRFPESVLGNSLPEWPGERWVDIRQMEIVTRVMENRIKLCKDAGFDGIDFDNIDGYENSTGFGLSKDDEIKYASWLAAKAHQYGLAAFQKNAPDLVGMLSSRFDGAVLEECSENGNNFCNQFSPYAAAGKPVLSISYNMHDESMTKFCELSKSLKFMGIGKTKALNKEAKFCPK